MTDDIVTRLREHASQIRCVVGVNTSVVIPMLELEAADEIERLRGERDRWMKAAKALIVECGHDPHCPAWLKNPNKKWECECGFDKPLALYKEALGETKQ